MATQTQALVAINEIKSQLDMAETDETPFTSKKIHDALKRHVTRFDYFRLDSDIDNLQFFCRPILDENIAQRLSVISERYTFANWTRIGYMADGFTIRTQRGVTVGSAKTPDSNDLIEASFTFTTAQTVPMYLKAEAYDIFAACVQLVLGTPGQSYHGLLSQSMLGDSEQYAIKEKIGYWRDMSRGLNKRRILRVRRA